MGEDFLSEGQFNIEVVEKEKIRISVPQLSGICVSVGRY